jgi:hypothetical protein
MLNGVKNLYPMRQACFVPAPPLKLKRQAVAVMNIAPIRHCESRHGRMKQSHPIEILRAAQDDKVTLLSKKR